jgi:hypothetical protein
MIMLMMLLSSAGAVGQVAGQMAIDDQINHIPQRCSALITLQCLSCFMTLNVSLPTLTPAGRTPCPTLPTPWCRSLSSSSR